MIIEKTCIVCPNGCDLSIEVGEGDQILVRGATCPRGEAYARQEVLHPMRTISSSVLVRHGERALVSARLKSPVPRERVMDVMDQIRALSVEAPVRAGDVLVPDILGLGSDLIATGTVEREGGEKA